MVLAAVGQFTATASLKQNAASVGNLIRQAAKLGARVLFLPEASDYIAGSPDETISLAQSVESSEFLGGLRQHLIELPASSRPEISVGVHEPADDGRVKNTLLWLDSTGKITHRYQKVHLFDVDIK